MRLFQKYLAKEAYAAIILVLLAFLSLFIFFDMLQELDEIQANYTFPVAFGYIALTSLGRVYELLPIAVLIGSLYTLSRFAARSEFTVIRISGLSTLQAVFMVLKIGVPLVILTFLFGEAIAPMADNLARQIKMEMTGKPVTKGGYSMKSGFWAHDRNYIINVREIIGTNRVSDMLIYEFDDNFGLKSIQSAKYAQFIKGLGWQLEEVAITQIGKNQVIAEQKAKSFWASGLDATIISISTINADRITLLNLIDYSRRLIENKERADRYLLALWKKIIYPLTCLVMMVIALPMAYQQHRAQKTALSLFIGILLGVAFYMLNAIVSSLGLLNDWPIPLIASLPSLIFLSIGMALLWRAERQ